MTIGASFEAGILDTIHSKVASVKGTLDRMIENYLEQQTEAIMLDPAQAFSLNASGFAIVDLGGPPASYYWVVRGLIVADAQLWGNSMGNATAQWGKGQSSVLQAGTAMPPIMIRWVFPSCPNAANFGTNQFNLKHGDRLFGQVVGGNANQNLVAVAMVEQWSVFSHAEFGAGPEAHS
jgi:hypothetical protein